MKIEDRQLVVCIKKGGCEDLEIRKLYEVLPDESASKDGYLRITDESGGDYLYPSNYFCQLDIERSIREELLQAA